MSRYHRHIASDRIAETVITEEFDLVTPECERGTVRVQPLQEWVSGMIYHLDLPTWRVRLAEWALNPKRGRK